jgi:hypothetical protein
VDRKRGCAQCHAAREGRHRRCAALVAHVGLTPWGDALLNAAAAVCAELVASLGLLKIPSRDLTRALEEAVSVRALHQAVR